MLEQVFNGNSIDNIPTIDKSPNQYIFDYNLIKESIIIIAHKMGFDVVTEGVETKEQLDILMKFRCDMIQGYLYSKPLAEDKAIEFLNN